MIFAQPYCMIYALPIHRRYTVIRSGRTEDYYNIGALFLIGFSVIIYHRTCKYVNYQQPKITANIVIRIFTFILSP